MAAPTVSDYVAAHGGSASDAKVIAAFAAGMAWARKTLGAAADATLTDLPDDNRQALFGFVSDVLKLPRAAFGYYGPADLEGLQIVAGDIGRRWQGQLQYGVRSAFGFA